MVEYYKREIADLNNTGRKQYRYEIHSKGNVNLDELAQNVQNRHRTLNSTELKGIVEDFIQEMAKQLSKGYSVTLGELGCFQLRIALTDEKREEEAERKANGKADSGTGIKEPNARSLGVRGINFKAGKRYVRDLKIAMGQRLRREEFGARHLMVSPFSLEGRIENAVNHVRQIGYIRIKEYAQINGISNSAASRELHELTNNRDDFPLMPDGRGPSRVYRLKQQSPV